MEAPGICDFIPMFHDYTRTLLGNLIELSKADWPGDAADAA